MALSIVFDVSYNLIDLSFKMDKSEEEMCMRGELSPTLQWWWTPSTGSFCYGECVNPTICCALVPAPNPEEDN